MKKIGLLCLALVLALGSLGIGYAMWSETLTVTGYVGTGWVDVNFHSQYDNDINSNDPMEAGSWSGFVAGTPVWSGARGNKNVASTTSSFTWAIKPSTDGNFATLTIANGYPCYWGSVVWDVQNDGSIPVKLHSVNLVELSRNAQSVWTGSIPLDIGTLYFVDTAPPNIDETLDAGDDFSFILSEKWTDQIDPVSMVGALHNGLGYLDVTVHVEQDAEQKMNYDFVIEYVFANWNEPEPD